MEKSVQRFLKQFNKAHKVDSIVPTDEEREELINLHNLEEVTRCLVISGCHFVFHTFF